MCNCLVLNDVFVDLDSTWIDQAIPYQGKALFGSFLAGWDSDEVKPELDYSEDYYQCLECGQYWYFKCSPDESSWPLFGIKLSGPERRLSEQEIESSQQLVTILAHNGFEAKQCRMKRSTSTINRVQSNHGIR